MPKGISNPAFEFRLITGFIAVALILGLVVALQFRNSRQFRATNLNAEQSQQRILLLDTILLSMVDAETGMRGFVLTGREEYLDPYESATNAMPSLTPQLDAISRAQLTPIIDAQFAFRQSIIDRIRAGTISRETIALNEGKTGMDQIRKSVADLRHREEITLQQLRAKSEASDQRTLFSLAILSSLVVALLLGGFFLIRHHLAARKKLEEERNRFFTLSHDLFGIANTKGFFTEVNPSWQKLLGFSAEEICATPFIEFVHPDDKAATIAEAEKLGKGERTIHFENRYRTRDGDYRWILWSAAPVSKGGLIYAVGRDITERKESESQLKQFAEEARRRTSELEALNLELEAFSYSVSHDLRAPLRHVAGYADMLQRHAQSTLDQKGNRFLDTIISSAKRMGMLIDDLLIFSRMGRSEMRREPVDLNAMVETMQNEFQEETRQRRVVWKKNPLPTVSADKAMLRQVMVNLLSNAVKYTGPRDPAEIEIFSEQIDGEIIVTVRDNGVGFDPAYAHKLFGVFQRLHEASEFEGTGIGLANVRRIISRHGGRVWAEGSLDKGAAFHFSLPKS